MASRNGSQASLARRTFVGLLWTGLGSGGMIVVKMAVMIVLARFLTPSEFGVGTTALVVVGFSSIFSQLGVGPAIVQLPVLERAHLACGGLVSVLVGVALWFLVADQAALIAGLLRMPALGDVLPILAYSFPIAATGVVADAQLQREMEFKWIAGREFLSYAVGYGLVAVPLAVAGHGYWSLVWAHLTQSSIRSAMMIAARPTPFGLGSQRALTELLVYGGGYSIGRIGTYVANQCDTILIARWLGPAAVGVYGRAYQLMAMPAVVFGQVVDRVLFPALSSIQHDAQRMERILMRGTALIALFVLPTSVMVSSYAESVVLVLLGTGWDGVVLPLRILAIATLFRTAYRMSDSLIRATGAVYRRAWRQLAFAGAVCIGVWWGARWGVAGVAVGVSFALMANFVLMTNLALNVAGAKWSKYLKQLLPGTLLAAIIWVESLAVQALVPSSGLLQLSAASLLTIASIAVAYWTVPRFAFGEHGLWLVASAQTKITGVLSRRRRRLQPSS